MTDTQRTDNGQAALWNGPSGRAWIDWQTVLDAMFKPFENLLVDALRAGHGRRVLDVGCGTGATTLAFARAVGAQGQAVGVDISAPMIAVARERAERERVPAHFVCADVQTHPFEPAGFDTIVSRFGVMFFDDPVRAFANLRGAATDGATLRFIAWRAPAENPFMTTAERAAAPLLPDLPARRPDGPGQFAFADHGRVVSILEASGWTDIDIVPIDIECTLPETELIGCFTRLGPLGLILQNVDERTRAQVVATVRAAYDPYVHGTEVRYTAACWMVVARASAA
ncbi:class I SAM-dependent methyltransferase [Paraburkholderia sp.]|uniref:class I SAM-dependent methyltransferase n=1 Tax=Paraburkholderia sp. TaxID=1926495 RepID=UPI003D6E5A84